MPLHIAIAIGFGLGLRCGGGGGGGGFGFRFGLAMSRMSNILCGGIGWLDGFACPLARMLRMISGIWFWFCGLKGIAIEN